MTNTKTKKETIEELKQLGTKLISQIKDKKNPEIELQERGLNNVNYHLSSKKFNTGAYVALFNINNKKYKKVFYVK